MRRKKAGKGIVMKKTERIYGAAVRLPQSLYFELRKRAVDAGCGSFNRYVRRLLENHIEEAKQHEAEEQPRT